MTQGCFKSQSIIFPGNLVKSDFLIIPDTNVRISKYEFFKGDEKNRYNWNELHYKLHEKNLGMSYANEFMAHFNNIIYCYKNKKPIFDASENPISKKEKKDLYKYFTPGFNSHIWTWINAKFDIEEIEKSLKKVIGIDSNNNLIFHREIPEECVMENCFVDFTKLNKQGFPVEKHSKQKYLGGKNIYFLKPKDGKVVKVVIGLSKSGFYCERDHYSKCCNLGAFGVVRNAVL